MAYLDVEFKIDYVRDTGDRSFSVVVMLKLSQEFSYWAHGFKHAIIFLFKTSQEKGLDGKHSFITQHMWNSSIQVVIDLEAMSVGDRV